MVTRCTLLGFLKTSGILAHDVHMHGTSAARHNGMRSVDEMGSPWVGTSTGARLPNHRSQSRPDMRAGTKGKPKRHASRPRYRLGGMGIEMGVAVPIAMRNRFEPHPNTCRPKLRMLDRENYCRDGVKGCGAHCSSTPVPCPRSVTVERVSFAMCCR